MGNMVAFSIRHDMANDLGDIGFDDIGYLHNTSDNRIKTAASSSLWLPEFSKVSRLPGVISTAYHHADGGADLLFTSEWMLRMPYRFNLQRGISREMDKRRGLGLASDTPYDKKLLMDSLRLSVREAPRKHPIHLSKSNGTPSSANTCQESFSVFGYLTDCFTDISRNRNVMPGILQIIETGIVDSKLFNSYSNQLVYLGTYGPEASCVVSMARNAFYAFPIPFRQLRISQEDQLEFLAQRESRKTTWQDNAIELGGMDAIARVFGYEMKRGLAPKKEASWEPK